MIHSILFLAAGDAQLHLRLQEDEKVLVFADRQHFLDEKALTSDHSFIIQYPTAFVVEGFDREATLSEGETQEVEIKYHENGKKVH